MRQTRRALIGGEHPVDQAFTIAAAAGGHQEIGLVWQLALIGIGRCLRQLSAQIAGERRLLDEMPHVRKFGQRIEDLGKAVDPDLVIEIVECRIDVLALPFLLEKTWLVHDVAQAEDQARAAVFEQVQRVADLAAQAERLLIDQEQMRIEDFGRVLDDRAAHRERLLDVEMQAERRVVAVSEFDHPWNAHEVDARLEVEAADDRRARQDQDRQLTIALHQMMGDRPATAQMAETEAVVAVDQEAGGGTHAGGQCLIGGVGKRLSTKPALHKVHSQRCRGKVGVIVELQPFASLRPMRFRPA